MIKKRLIFTLLYSNGYFFQSRNFNLQKVGDVNWLKENYNFKNISFFIDELIILNISKDKKEKEKFLDNIKKVSEFCFVPITIGGGIKNLNDAKFYLQNSCDKIFLNSELFNNPGVINQISKVYGEQSIIAGIDLKKENNNYFLYKNNGQEKIFDDPKKILKQLIKYNFGELFINSIDKDGTGTGLDYDLLELIPKEFNKPVILSGGTGNYKHIYIALHEKNVNAVATSNLLNFLGDGLIKTRNELLKKKISFPEWNINQIKNLEYIFKK